MSWTTPRTWVTGELVTASIMNTHVRDNLGALQPQSAQVSTSETSTSTSYTNLATSGPAVTLTTGTQALLSISATGSNNTSNASIYMSYAVSGASTVSASDSTALIISSYTGGIGFSGSAVYLLSGLTAGSNTFTAKYKVSSNTGSWSNRSLIVEACY